MDLQALLAPYTSAPSAFEFAGGFVQDPYFGIVYKNGTIHMEPVFLEDIHWKAFSIQDIYAYVACEQPGKWVAHIFDTNECVLLGGSTSLYNKMIHSLDSAV